MLHRLCHARGAHSGAFKRSVWARCPAELRRVCVSAVRSGQRHSRGNSRGQGTLYQRAVCERVEPCFEIAFLDAFSIILVLYRKITEFAFISLPFVSLDSPFCCIPCRRLLCRWQPLWPAASFVSLCACDVLTLRISNLATPSLVVIILKLL